MTVELFLREVGLPYSLAACGSTKIEDAAYIYFIPVADIDISLEVLQRNFGTLQPIYTWRGRFTTQTLASLTELL
jgi:hypothetical protein